MERYEAYKDSGVEWIGEVPSSWSCLKFRWVLNKVSRTPLEDDGVITCFRDGEVTLRSNRREDGFTMSDKEIGYQHICRGDFVIHGMDGFAGAMGISDSDGKASPVLMVFEPKRDTDLRYINYLLRFYAWQDVFLSLSTTIRVRSCDLNWNKVAPIPLVVPAPNEQKAIADYLDAKTAEIDDIVSETERSIELLREYRKSVISEAVTKGLDPNAPMKDSGVEWIGELPSGWNCQMLKTVVRNRVEGANAASGQYIGLENIQSWTQKYVKSESVNDDSSGILYDSRCVMFGKLRPYLAKAYVPSGSGPCSSEFLTLIPGCMNRRYLAYLLTSGPFIDEVNSRTYGVKMPRAGWDLIGKIKVPCPPDIVQCAIANYLDAKTSEIDALIADKERQVELLKEYRKSLISEAVTGKFKVPGVS